MIKFSEPCGPLQAGFTLLEVMIATVLLSVMMTLLMGSMRIGADSWEQGERMAERTSRMLVLNNFFRSHLSDIKPLSESVSNPRQLGLQPRMVFQGGPTVLEYAGTLPPQVRGGIYRFRLYLAEDREGGDLKLAIRPFASVNESGDAPIEDLLILENVESLRFSYLEKGSAEGEVRWKDEWKANVLPPLIRIEIAVRGEPPWPPMVISPRTELAQ